MNLLRLSWKNLTFKPLSMLLSLVLFALGVGLISLLLLLNTQIEEKFEKNLAGIDLVIGAKGSPLQLILCSMYHIDAPTGNISIGASKAFMNPKHPLIQLAVPVSMGDSYKGYRIIGTNHDFADSLYNGRLAEGKLWAANYEVTIGAVVAQELGLKIGDRFYSAHGLADDGMNIHDHGDGFKVVGIFQPGGNVMDQLILTSTQSIWDVHDHEGHDHESGEGHDHGDHEGHDHGDHEGHDHGDHEGHDHGDHEGHDHASHEGHDHASHEGHDHASHEGHDHEDHEGHDHASHEGHDHEDHEGHDHASHEGHDHGDHEGHDHASHEGHDHGDHEGHDHASHEGHDHGDHEGHDHASHEGHDHEGHDHASHEGHDHGDHEGHDHASHEGHDHAAEKPAELVAVKPLTEEVDKEITALLVRYRNKSNWRSLNLPRNINENTDMQAASPAIEMNRLMSMMGAGEQILRNLALIIVFVSGLSIFISLFSSLKERRYELALMRVMGASRGRLFLLIIIEGLILAVLGYVVGLLLSHLSMELFSSYMKDAYRYSFTGRMFLTAEFLLLAGAVFIGFLAAVLPAMSASKTDISTTLTQS